MKTKDENIVVTKTYAFALRCVKLYKYLCEEKHDYVIGRQEILKLLMSIVKSSNENQL